MLEKSIVDHTTVNPRSDKNLGLTNESMNTCAARERWQGPHIIFSWIE